MKVANFLRKSSLVRHLYKTLDCFFLRIFGNNRFRKIGCNNHIRTSRYVSFKDCRITIKGSNNTVIFEESCTLRGLNILVIGVGNIISFGKHTVVNASRLQPTVINCVGGGKIIIGQGALFSNNIEIHNTDYHGIYNLNGERINPEKDITIGKSVWIGLGSKILKGTHLSDYTIVGCGSLVSGNFSEKSVIIAGNPAKVIKSEVFWNHQREILCPIPEDLNLGYKKTND